MARSSSRRPASERTERLRSARKVQRTRLGTAVGVVSILAGVVGAFLTLWSLGAVMAEFGVLALPPLLLTQIAAGCAVIGGIGLLLPKTWGWWVALAGAVLGLADLFRLYRGLFGSIDPSHPRAGEVTAKLLGIVGVPALLFIAVLALLMQHSVRVSYRITSER